MSPRCIHDVAPIPWSRDTHAARWIVAGRFQIRRNRCSGCGATRRPRPARCGHIQHRSRRKNPFHHATVPFLGASDQPLAAIPPGSTIRQFNRDTRNSAWRSHREALHSGTTNCQTIWVLECSGQVGCRRYQRFRRVVEAVELNWWNGEQTDATWNVARREAPAVIAVTIAR